jgi:hypothetical protein
MPSLGAEITPGNRMVTTWIRADDPVPVNLEVHTAAAAAVITDGHDIMHRNSLPASLKNCLIYKAFPS